MPGYPPWGLTKTPPSRGPIRISGGDPEAEDMWFGVLGRGFRDEFWGGGSGPIICSVVFGWRFWRAGLQGPGLRWSVVGSWVQRRVAGRRM
eukprot:50584-Chlamydomonas_euryale.AAC.1